MSNNVFEKIEHQGDAIDQIATKLEGISIQDLYALAKRTWDYKDYEMAQKYYNHISLLNPLDWEAPFYASLCGEMGRDAIAEWQEKPRIVFGYEQKNAIQKDWQLGDYYITRDYFESQMKGFEVFPGDVIVSCAGTIGESYVMPSECEQGIINQALMRMRIVEAMNLEYFLLYFDYVLKSSARKSSKGAAIKNIPPFEILKNMVMPLPPVEEQKRILARVEKLLAVCDELKRGESNEKHD